MSGPLADLDRPAWDRLAPEARMRRARSLLGLIPSGFDLMGIERFHQNGQECDVAMYRGYDALFALVPGAEVVLGYDPDRPWEPDERERMSWEEMVADYEIDSTLTDYLHESLTPLRTVRVGPFLVEVSAREGAGPEPFPPDDPDLADWVAEARTKARSLGAAADRAGHPFTGLTTIHSREGEEVRVHVDCEGATTAERVVLRDPADQLLELARAGFRALTSDEWEYACGAGSRTLYRWGDHAPAAHILDDADDSPQRRPNAFGLRIAEDPYAWELIDPPGAFRGGDGGTAICGGLGHLATWLTLATAARPAEAPGPYGMHVRRAVGLR